MKTIGVKLFCILLCVAGTAAFAGDFSFGMGAGRIGLAGAAGSGFARGAIQGDVLELSAIHEPTGLGVELSPFAYRLVSDWDGSALTLVNLTLFQRTFSINGSSVLGPFFTVNCLDFSKTGPAFRAGLRFSWRKPWTSHGQEVLEDFPVRPLITLLDLEAGAAWGEGIAQGSPRLYAAVSVDAAAFMALAAILSMGTATERVDAVHPGYSGMLPKDRDDDTNPVAIPPDHP